MGVVAQISVGDIMYYQVDDIPTHTAPKGSVALMTSGTTYENGFTYVNNDGGTVWLKCISPSYGEISLTNATNEIDFDTPQAIGSFYPYNSTPTGASWIRNTNSSDDWILATENTDTDDLKYTGSTIMRAFISSNTTVRGGTAKWVSHNITTAQNFTVLTTSINQYYTADNGATASCGHQSIREVLTDDYFLPAISPVAREGGGGSATRSYIPKHAQLSVIKIDEPLISVPIPSEDVTLLSENWETSGFTENPWTVVNGTNNVWVVGQSEASGGTSSAYISNDGGTTAAYTITTADASHIYIDINFQSIYSAMTLNFDWKCWAENAAAATSYDYGVVYMTDTTITPTAGAELLPTTQATAGGNGRIGATTNLGKFNLGYGGADNNWRNESIDLVDYLGSGNKRIVFTWKNDGSVGVDPPFVIDNIIISGQTASGAQTLTY